MIVKNNEKGITLVELIAAIAILSIILISIMSIFPQMGLMNKHNEEKSQAINSAKQILNEWRTDPDVKSALKSGTPWPSTPVITTDYYLFKTTNPTAEIKIWKQPEKGFTTSELINTYKIQVQVKNEKNLVISETYGYVVIKREAQVNGS